MVGTAMTAKWKFNDGWFPESGDKKKKKTLEI